MVDTVACSLDVIDVIDVMLVPFGDKEIWGKAAAAFARKKSVKSPGGRNMATCYSCQSGLQKNRLRASSALTH
jgi:hypothetical protein